MEQRISLVTLGVVDLERSRRFYEQLGIVHIDDWAPYRLRGEALVRLAALDVG